MKTDDGIRQASTALDGVRYSVEQKAKVHATLDAILDRLDEMQRRPAPWEENCLVLALNYLESGLYARAQKELNDCVQPAAERSAWREQQVSRNPPRYSVARLRTRFEGVKAANR